MEPGKKARFRRAGTKKPAIVINLAGGPIEAECSQRTDLRAQGVSSTAQQHGHLLDAPGSATVAKPTVPGPGQDGAQSQQLTQAAVASQLPAIHDISGASLGVAAPLGAEGKPQQAQQHTAAQDPMPDILARLNHQFSQNAASLPMRPAGLPGPPHLNLQGPPLPAPSQQASSHTLPPSWSHALVPSCPELLQLLLVPPAVVWVLAEVQRACTAASRGIVNAEQKQAGFLSGVLVAHNLSGGPAVRLVRSATVPDLAATKLTVSDTRLHVLASPMLDIKLLSAVHLQGLRPAEVEGLVAEFACTCLKAGTIQPLFSKQQVLDTLHRVHSALHAWHVVLKSQAQRRCTALLHPNRPASSAVEHWWPTRLLQSNSELVTELATEVSAALCKEPPQQLQQLVVSLPSCGDSQQQWLAAAGSWFKRITSASGIPTPASNTHHINGKHAATDCASLGTQSQHSSKDNSSSQSQSPAFKRSRTRSPARRTRHSRSPPHRRSRSRTPPRKPAYSRSRSPARRRPHALPRRVHARSPCRDGKGGRSRSRSRSRSRERRRDSRDRPRSTREGGNGRSRRPRSRSRSRSRGRQSSKRSRSTTRQTKDSSQHSCPSDTNHADYRSVEPSQNGNGICGGVNEPGVLTVAPAADVASKQLATCLPLPPHLMPRYQQAAFLQQAPYVPPPNPQSPSPSPHPSTICGAMDATNQHLNSQHAAHFLSSMDQLLSNNDQHAAVEPAGLAAMSTSAHPDQASGCCKNVAPMEGTATASTQVASTAERSASLSPPLPAVPIVHLAPVENPAALYIPDTNAAAKHPLSDNELNEYAAQPCRAGDDVLPMLHFLQARLVKWLQIKSPRGLPVEELDAATHQRRQALDSALFSPSELEDHRERCQFAVPPWLLARMGLPSARHIITALSMQMQLFRVENNEIKLMPGYTRTIGARLKAASSAPFAVEAEDMAVLQEAQRAAAAEQESIRAAEQEAILQQEARQAAAAEQEAMQQEPRQAEAVAAAEQLQAALTAVGTPPVEQLSQSVMCAPQSEAQPAAAGGHGNTGVAGTGTVGNPVAATAVAGPAPGAASSVTAATEAANAASSETAAQPLLTEQLVTQIQQHLDLLRHPRQPGVPVGPAELLAALQTVLPPPAMPPGSLHQPPNAVPLQQPPGLQVPLPLPFLSFVSGGMTHPLPAFPPGSLPPALPMTGLLLPGLPLGPVPQGPVPQGPVPPGPGPLGPGTPGPGPLGPAPLGPIPLEQLMSILSQQPSCLNLPLASNASGGQASSSQFPPSTSTGRTGLPAAESAPGTMQVDAALKLATHAQSSYSSSLAALVAATAQPEDASQCQPYDKRPMPHQSRCVLLFLATKDDCTATVVELDSECPYPPHASVIVTLWAQENADLFKFTEAGQCIAMQKGKTRAAQLLREAAMAQRSNGAPQARVHPAPPRRPYQRPFYQPDSLGPSASTALELILGTGEARPAHAEGSRAHGQDQTLQQPVHPALQQPAVQPPVEGLDVTGTGYLLSAVADV